ncbi:hypothetical protein KC725_05495 [Candidatus Peregrinibacteria bacterium]|nr:hypothetical protein [Candidatus Peregrinibacteria bacterium]
MKLFQKAKQPAEYLLGILRIALGWIFLWAFVDKLFGLGFATCHTESGVTEVLCQNAWLSGGSPTSGFLTHGTQGPFAGIFQAMAGNPIVDWLFMLGLLGIGVSLVFGVAMKLGGWSTALLMLLMYLASSILPENNPVIDEHIIYGITALALAYSDAGKTFGLGEWWTKTELVKKNKWLA